MPGERGFRGAAGGEPGGACAKPVTAVNGLAIAPKPPLAGEPTATPLGGLAGGIGDTGEPTAAATGDNGADDDGDDDGDAPEDDADGASSSSSASKYSSSRLIGAAVRRRAARLAGVTVAVPGPVLRSRGHNVHPRQVGGGCAR